MSTTTLRLPDDVKQRIDRLAAAQGRSGPRIDGRHARRKHRGDGAAR